MAINPIFLTVSLVTQLQGGVPIGYASGFFYEHGDQLFFVTNQHVVKDPHVAADKLPDKLRLKLHTDLNDVRKNGDLEIALYDDKKASLWKNHSTYKDADVAVIKLDRTKIDGKFQIKSWNKDNFLPSKYTMEPGEDVFIIGYPFGFSDDVLNLPVLRGGMVASAYSAHFKGMPLFVTDINLHPGTSGSPVIAKPKSTWVNQDTGATELNTGTTYYLLGVHSGLLNVPNPADGKVTQIGLGAAWYADIVEEIAAEFK